VACITGFAALLRLDEVASQNNKMKQTYLQNTIFVEMLARDKCHAE
jgi:hypothetical protein